MSSQMKKSCADEIKTLQEKSMNALKTCLAPVNFTKVKAKARARESANSTRQNMELKERMSRYQKTPNDVDSQHISEML